MLLLINKNSTRKQKNASLKEKYNRSTYYFLNSLFHSSIKDGKKFRTLNFFSKLFFLIKSKFRRRGRGMILFFFFYIIYKRLYSKIYLRMQHLGFKAIYLIPVISIRKSVFLAKSWILNSLKERRERTFVLRLYSELCDLWYFKGFALAKKVQYYKLIKKSWVNFRFLKFLGVTSRPRALWNVDRDILIILKKKRRIKNFFFNRRGENQHYKRAGKKITKYKWRYVNISKKG